MNASELIKRIAFSKAYEFLDRDPEQNFLKLVDWLQKLDKTGYVARQLPTVRKYANDPNSNWYKLALSFWKDVDDEVRKTLFTNFMINGNLLENQKLAENRKACQCNIPWVILLDLKSDDPIFTENQIQIPPLQEELTFDELDNIIEQGKECGIYYFAFSAGKSQERQEEIIALCNKNSECVFLYGADSCCFDETFAQEALRVHNLIPVVAMSGFQQEMDKVEDGLYEQTLQAMATLKKYRLPFGILACYTAQNCETLGSEAFFDAMIEWGAKFAYFNAVLPDGKKAVSENLISAQQREFLFHQLRHFRQTKALLTLNHWNDGKMTGGCIAGGHGYCYINVRGDLEPCNYIHYSDSNIREKTLLEAFQSSLFLGFHACQEKFTDFLRPCLLADHPELLQKIMEKSQAKPVLWESTMELSRLCQLCGRDRQEWQQIAERLQKEYGNTYYFG